MRIPTQKTWGQRFLGRLSAQLFMECHTTAAGVAQDGTIYLGDDQRDLIWKVDPMGEPEIWIGGRDHYEDEPRFDRPTVLGPDSEGNCYAEDRDGRIRRISPKGAATTLPAPLWPEDVHGCRTTDIVLRFRYVEWAFLEGQIYILDLGKEEHTYLSFGEYEKVPVLQKIVLK
ncbi:hypothetical protein ED312_11535 [Sinomicrobium pectinilyticum]|uniref:Uncharacterized protein n=1 Tax=Sinomicrobium pectinilyticum TaxID=1084421 RepID=A0A3N0EEI4_SINP1|nr:hypothetical protein [Sinomicrobium pectinilyticum]RNL86265.1 hypothetical protein ED312_11535 [Sinomicrobium pectinilyticum]